MISIPINKSFSQISVVSSKLAPRKKGKKQWWKKLERVFRRPFPAQEESLFWNRDKDDLKGRIPANSDKLISQERNDERSVRDQLPFNLPLC